jgi:hypothetical protein
LVLANLDLDAHAYEGFGEGAAICFSRKILGWPAMRVERHLQNLRGEMVQSSREFGSFSTNCELEDWGGTRGYQ